MAVGCQWRIGTGHGVRIWKGHWVLGTPKLPTIQSEGGAMAHEEEAIVDSLLDGMFSSSVASEILNIVLSHGGLDLFYWTQETHGDYTVKSAYSLFRSLTHCKQCGES